MLLLATPLPFVYINLYYNCTLTAARGTDVDADPTSSRNMWNLNSRTGSNVVRSLHFQYISGIMIYLIVKAKLATPSVIDGDPESSIKGFYCIYYNFETLRCEWKAGKLSNGNYELQYWQQGMSEKETCDHYLKTNGKNTGCTFGRQELQLFSNLFVCVTGFPGMDPIRPSYFTFQLQNIGKPGPPEDVNISKSQVDEFTLDWTPPNGKIPSHCLEYEIQYKDQTDTWKTIAEQRESFHSFNMSGPLPGFCVRIRGKTNRYCADDGYWSDWSSESCWEESSPLPEIPNMKWVYCIGVFAAVLLGFFVIAVLYVVRKKRHWSEKLQHKAKEIVY
ncbi:interleukin-13 receptor subunit alpha-2 isoform X2 [Rana temporaria]|uniref:interleukin-13 receptor subunit alpha-2 isoform X2 n=1 Tax=Rana temporaria TaxID=8407 RepID=UPI001AADF839|nr:interleukin-13 receptor subunit alpha-2 isoform X2 [Rana temporaria]